MKTNLEWYIQREGKATGPFSLADLKDQVRQGLLLGHDLVYRDGSDEWKRAFDWPDLAAEIFAEERTSFTRLFTLPNAESLRSQDEWILLTRSVSEQEYRFRQLGPFTTQAVRDLLQKKTILPSDHIWKRGFSKWVAIYTREEFSPSLWNVKAESIPLLAKIEEAPPPEVPEVREVPPVQSPVVAKVSSVPAGEEKTTPVEFKLPQPTTPAPAAAAPPVAASSVSAPTALPSSESAKSKKEEKIKESSENSAKQKKAKKSFLDSSWLTAAVLLAILGASFVLVAPRFLKKGLWRNDVVTEVLPQPEEMNPPADLGQPPLVHEVAMSQDSVGSESSEAPSPEFQVRGEGEGEIESPPNLPEANLTPQAESKPESFKEAAKEPQKSAPSPEAWILKTKLSPDTLVQVQVSGASGQVLQVPAVTLKTEFKVSEKGQVVVEPHRLGLPEGQYQVRLSREGQTLLTVEKTLVQNRKDFQKRLSAHRKKIVFDQQQEKKNLIQSIDAHQKAMKSWPSVPVVQMTDKQRKKIAADLKKLSRVEFRKIQSARHNLMFVSGWTQLSNLHQQLRDVMEKEPRLPAAAQSPGAWQKQLTQLRTDISQTTLWLGR